MIQWRLVDGNGDEVELHEVRVNHAWSAGFGFDEDGNLFAEENGEPVDELRAVEIYASLGGVIGWSLMDAVDPR